MWPLRSGMAVRVTDASDVAVGDLVVFIAADGASVFAHRVIRATKTTLTTRGDTNSYDDPTVPRAAVIGRVDAIRWQSTEVAMPSAGTRARVQRTLGLSWARVAPHLRLLWRQLRKV